MPGNTGMVGNAPAVSVPPARTRSPEGERAAAASLWIDSQSACGSPPAGGKQAEKGVNGDSVARWLEGLFVTCSCPVHVLFLCLFRPLSEAEQDAGRVGLDNPA